MVEKDGPAERQLCQTPLLEVFQDPENYRAPGDFAAGFKILFLKCADSPLNPRLPWRSTELSKRSMVAKLESCMLSTFKTTNPSPSNDPLRADAQNKSSLSAIQTIVYTRYEHGNYPVKVFTCPHSGDTNYELQKPEGFKVFKSARSLMKELYGRDVHMPFDRYFRLGKYRQAGRTSGSANLLTLLDSGKVLTKRTPISVHAPAKTSITSLKQTKITYSKSKLEEAEGLKMPKGTFEPSASSKDTEVQEFLGVLREQVGASGKAEVVADLAEVNPELMQGYEKALNLVMDKIEERVGIDLEARGHEVRKLLFAGFAGKMLSRGYDPEEVLQEIYAGLLVRNRGTCPWDIRKSSFGHYVHMAINCILTNYHRKQTRRIDTESVSLVEEACDVGQWGSCEIESGSELGDEKVFDQLYEHVQGIPDNSIEAQVGKEILPLVVAGYRRAEIAEKTGKRASLISRALAWVRKETAIWASENYLSGLVPQKYLSE